MRRSSRPLRVNVCWEINEERRCETLSKEQAYALRKDIEEDGGIIFWFQPVED